MQRWREFIPKSYLYLRKSYTWQTFRKDLFAGLTVGVIALPLAMAFGEDNLKKNDIAICIF